MTSISLAASSNVQITTVGNPASLAGITAALTGTGTSSVTLTFSGVASDIRIMSVSFYAASAVFSGSSTLILSYPEPLGATTLPTSVFPLLVWYNGSGVVQPATNIFLANSGGTFTISKSSITGGLPYFFSFKIL